MQSQHHQDSHSQTYRPPLNQENHHLAPGRYQPPQSEYQNAPLQGEYPAQQSSYPAPTHPPAQVEQEYTSQFKQYFSLKSHGGKAAFEIKPACTRGGWSTVMLEAASSIGQRKYDWQSKACIQLTRN